MTSFSTFRKTQEISTFTWHWWISQTKSTELRLGLCIFLRAYTCACVYVPRRTWCKQMPISAFLWRTGKTKPDIYIIFKKISYVTNLLRQRWCLLCVFFTSNYNVSIIKKKTLRHIMCTSNVSIWFPSKFCFKIFKIITFSEQLMWQRSTGILPCLFKWILFSSYEGATKYIIVSGFSPSPFLSTFFHSQKLWIYP